MTEAELRSASGNYVRAVWNELKREGSPFEYMRSEPCEVILHQIDNKITQLVNLLKQNEDDNQSGEQKS